MKNSPIQILEEMIDKTLSLLLPVDSGYSRSALCTCIVIAANRASRADSLIAIDLSKKLQNQILDIMNDSPRCYLSDYYETKAITQDPVETQQLRRAVLHMVATSVKHDLLTKRIV